MIRLRRNAVPPAVTISPPLPERANAATPRSISPGSRTLNGVSSTPNDCATDWIALNWPMPAAKVGSRKTATRVTCGAICLSNSTHFPLMAVFVICEHAGVAAGQRQALDEAGPEPVGQIHEHDWDGLGRLQQQPSGRAANGQKDVRRERDQFRRISADGSGVATGRAIVDLQVSANRPAQLPQALLEHHV